MYKRSHLLLFRKWRNSFEKRVNCSERDLLLCFIIYQSTRTDCERRNCHSFWCIFGARYVSSWIANRSIPMSWTIHEHKIKFTIFLRTNQLRYASRLPKTPGANSSLGIPSTNCIQLWRHWNKSVIVRRKYPIHPLLKCCAERSMNAAGPYPKRNNVCVYCESQLCVFVWVFRFTALNHIQFAEWTTSYVIEFKHKLLHPHQTITTR